MAGLRTFAILLLPHVGARVAHRSTSEAASPPTLSPTAGVCADPPAAFEPLLLPYTVIWGTECVDALVLSSEWLEPFRSSGGMASVCNSSVRDWLAATAAFSDLLLWSPSSWSSPVGEEQRIAYICPATCARAGVYVGGCEPPAPLVYEEAVHLNHTAVARTGEELRAHVRAASRIGGVEVQLLAGTVLRLNGTSIPIDGVNVTIWSDGGGAVLDADHLSSLFEVRNGGHLRLLALTLTNGLALTSGGCVSVSGGSAVIRGCTLLNSSALSGGALSVTNGRLQVVDSTLSACSAAWGGALAVNGEHSSAELSSSVVASTVSLRVGGAIFSSGGVTTVDGSTIAYCSSVINGGSLYVFSGGSFVTFTNNSTITHSSTIWGSGGVALMWTNTESVITFENATSIRYTRTGEAGALLLLNGVIRLLSGSIIENSTARTYGGHVYMWGGSFIAEDATLRGGSAESGGCIYLFASHSSSLVRLRDTVAEHHTASIHGGLIYVSGGDSLVEFVDSTLVHSSAAQDGGTIWMSSGIMVATATSILQSSAGQSGGVLTISGGTALISSGSKLLGSNAFRYGGAVSISGGSVTLNSSQIRDSSTSDDGGAIASTGGLVLVTKSIISDSFCEWLGAAFRMRGGVVNVKNSKITRSTGSWGGAVSIAGGTMTISDNSLVVDSIATLHGGTFHITGGTVQVMGDSAIVNSTSNERGGLIYMSAGTIRITSSLVEQCKSNSREGSVLYARSEDFGGLDTLVVFTFVHLVQDECEGPLLVGGTSEQVVLRRLTFSAPQQCVLPASLVNEKQCGETFVNFETNEEESVCDSTLPGACTTTLVPGTTLHSHSCDCPWTEIIDDTFGDPLLAPYTKSGCIQPLALSGISVISTRVVVALTKPTPKTQSLNVTLHIVGTDVSRVVNWTVSPPQTNRSWFHFPFEQGQVAASTLSDGGIDVPVPLVLSAHNLQEQATPYEQRVPISVFSEIAGVSRTMQLEILLSVQAATSFVVWGLVKRTFFGPEVCDRTREPSLDCSFTVGEQCSVPFTGCDEDSLPVDHQLPRQGDARRFSATLSTSSTFQPVGLEYTGDGVYFALLSIPRWGAFTLTIELSGQVTERLVESAKCPSTLLPTSDGRCGCRAGDFQPTISEPCVPCTPFGAGSLDGAVGIGSCNICRQGFYRTSADEAVFSCRPCPQGAYCPLNATISSITLLDGYWRLSPQSTQFFRCANGTETFCVGGAHAGVCSEGHRGVRCEVCTKDDSYFLDDRCVDCPRTAVTILWTLALAVGLVLATVPLKGCLHHFECSCRKPYLFDHAMISSLVRDVGWGSKVRIAISFYQCIASVGPIFLLSLPQYFTDLMGVLGTLDFNWLADALPGPCLGNAQRRMLLVALVPLALILFIIVCHISRNYIARESLLTRSSNLISASLFIIFLSASRVSRIIFQSFDCVPFEYSAEEKRYFLRTSLDVECHTPAHDDILTVAYVLIALWPIGSVMLFAVLAYRARLRLKLRVYDKFVHSIRFLHGDFKPDFYYWASVELAQRCALTGWILLVDAEYSFYRVALAQAIALVMLAMSMMLQPYRNQEDNLFLSASKGLLVIAYTCCSYIKVIDDVKEASDEEVASIVFGYTSPDPVIVILVITASLVAFILLCAVFHRAKVERGMQLLRLQDDSLPELMLLPGHRWMLFLSHVWSTGQDQVATIKRQLQRMLPGITIFLDVDDLTDLGQLEQYVHESCSILLFISSGYFLSRNCQREITATLKKSKPRIHVFEPHPGKGVAHSRTLPAENVLQSYTLNSSASNNGLFHGIE